MYRHWYAQAAQCTDIHIGKDPAFILKKFHRGFIGGGGFLFFNPCEKGY